MNVKLFILVAAASLIFSFLAAIAAQGRMRLGMRWAGLVGSLVHLVVAGWATFKIVFEMPLGEKLDWTLTWFTFLSKPVFQISFAIEGWNSLLWFVFGFLLFMTDYLGLMGRNTEEENASQGHLIARYALGIGAFLSILSGNLITFILGWVVLGFAGFLGIALSPVRKPEVPQYAFQSYVFGFFAELLMLLGVFGLSIEFGSLSFSEVNEHILADGGPKFWAASLVLLGTMLRSFQLPFLNRAQYAGSSSHVTPVLLILGHVIVSSVLISKLYPIITSVEDLRVFAVLPSLTCLFSATFAMSEDRFSRFLGWIAAYICGGVFLLLLQNGYQAAQMTALSGSVALFVLAAAKYYLPAALPLQQWFLAIGALSLMAVPVFGFGQARQWEYLSYIHLAESGSAPSWIVLSTKVLADLLLGIALLRILRSPNREKPDPAHPVPWETVVPLSICSILCISGVFGGRWLGGLFGQMEVEIAGKSLWFDRVVNIPMVVRQTSVGDLVGGEADVISRILVVTVLSLSSIVALTWIWRDRKSTEEFQARWAQFVTKINIARFFEFLFWDLGIRGGGKAIGKFAGLFDQKLFDAALYKAASRPIKQLGRGVQLFDFKVIDRMLIDGLGQGVLLLGKSLRLLQNGQVQFYIAFGLIVMIAILVRYGFQIGG